MGGYLYEVVEDADRECPLNPGLTLNHLEMDRMLEMESIAEGSLLRNRSSGLQEVRRINGRLQLRPARRVRAAQHG